MKKLGLFFITLLLIASCTLEPDETVPFHIEFLEVESVVIPETVTPGNIYEITVTYRKPTDCHYFDGFYYEANGSERVVAPQAIVIEDAECLPLTDEEPEEASFDFECKTSYTESSYHFKFYSGEDANGNQTYIEREVQVMQ